jgi:hypothetical protein
MVFWGILGNFNLQCTVSRILLPYSSRGFGECVESILQFDLGFIPSFEFSHVLFWSSGKLELVRESEEAINILEEVESSADFFSNLGLVSP